MSIQTVTDYPLCGDKFWAKVDKTAGCWNWTGYKNQHGYGRAMTTLSHGVHKLMAVHRLSYAHHIGAIPDGMVVMHSCDNRACVNPAHLMLGSQSENVSDMVEKGRHVAGRAPGGRLSADFDIEALAALRDANYGRQWVRPRHFGKQYRNTIKRLAERGYVSCQRLSPPGAKMVHCAYRISDTGIKLLKLAGAKVA